MKLDIILSVLLILIFCVLIAFYISLWVRYGDKPLGEVPTWVAWLLFKD